MPRFKAWLLALALAGLPTAAQAETVALQGVCVPSHVAIAVLRENGMSVIDAWVSDSGWPVELWSDGHDGRAVVVVGQDDIGRLMRCLPLSKTAGEKS